MSNKIRGEKSNVLIVDECCHNEVEFIEAKALSKKVKEELEEDDPETEEESNERLRINKRKHNKATTDSKKAG